MASLLFFNHYVKSVVSHVKDLPNGFSLPAIFWWFARDKIEVDYKICSNSTFQEEDDVDEQNKSKRKKLMPIQA